jgi:1,4-alpha-glucan branching enzyme
MGSEFGQWIEWNSGGSLDWHLLEYDSHRQLQRLVRDLNLVLRAEPALHQVDFDWTGFEWIDFRDADNSVLAFLRRARDPNDHVVVACNLTPVPRYNYRVGVPSNGFYREIINTDAAHYGGSGVVNQPGVQALYRQWQSQPYCVELTLPPLGVVILKPGR